MQFPDTQPVYLFAVRQILRLIKRTGLKPGHHLPPDIKLPALVGCSDHAVRGAMNLLARQGVLSRRRRHGTKILNLALVPPGVWSVGITAKPAATGRNLSFESYLLHTIRAHLSEKGVMDRTIIEQADSLITQESELEVLNPHLPSLLREDLIQGVVTCRRVALTNAPVLHVGSWELATWGVVIDAAVMVRIALDRIYGSRVKRVAFVANLKPVPGYNRGYLEAINLAGVLGIQLQLVHSSPDAIGVEQSAAEIANELLQMPARSRPRALIFVDDVLAFLVTRRLVTNPGYRPEVYTMVNDDTMIAFPLRTHSFAVNLDEMGRIAAREMIASLGVEMAANRVVWIEPREDSDASHRSMMPYSGPVVRRSGRSASTKD